MEQFTEPDDRQIRGALHGVELPSGLRARMRTRLQSQLEASSLEAPNQILTHLIDTASEVPSASVGDIGTLAQPERSAATHRRQWLGLAMALSLASALFGLYHFSRPMSPERLAQHCLLQLDGLLSPDATWQTSFEPQQLSLLEAQLRRNVQPLGFQDHSGLPFAQRCRIWQMFSHATQKPFFVFDFQEARSVESLNSQLQSIKRVSHGWSLVALRSGDHVFVIAFDGPVADYLNIRQAA